MLATAVVKIDDLRQEYNELVMRVFDIAKKHHAPLANRRDFLRFFMLGAGRTLVALDQLKALKVAHGGKLDIGKCERKQLICDMEKVSNFLKALDYYAQYDYLK